MIEFETPGEAKQTQDESNAVAYQCNVKGAMYHVSVERLEDPSQDADAMLTKICNAILGGFPGAQVVTNEKISLAGRPGRDLMFGIPGELRWRQQTFAVDGYLVSVGLSSEADGDVTPADVERYFSSLKVVGSEKPAGPAGAASHAAFVEALAAGDERAIYAMFHSEIQAAVDLAMLRLYLHIVKSELGKITAKSTDALELIDETAGEFKYKRGVDTLPCENGSLKVTTGVADGRIVTFLLESPKLTPERISIRTFEYLSDLGDKTKDFAEQYMPPCEKFARTLFDDGAEAAFALLDPRVQAEFKTKGAPGKLAKIREAFGPIKKLELASFRVEGHPQKGLDEFQIILAAERPGKSEGTIRFSFAVDGLKAAIVGYSFEEPGAAPADPKAPADPLRDLPDDDKPAPKTPPPSTATPVAPPSIAPPIP